MLPLRINVEDEGAFLCMWEHNDPTSSAQRAITKPHELILVAQRIGKSHLPYWCLVYVKLSRLSSVLRKLAPDTHRGYGMHHSFVPPIPSVALLPWIPS